MTRSGELNLNHKVLRLTLHPISAIMIAAWLCSMLEVVIISNVYQYFTRFKNDHILLKLLVGFTVFIDFAGMIGCYGLIYMVRSELSQSSLSLILMHDSAQTTVTYWGNEYILTYQVIAL